MAITRARPQRTSAAPAQAAAGAGVGAGPAGSPRRHSRRATQIATAKAAIERHDKLPDRVRMVGAIAMLLARPALVGLLLQGRNLAIAELLEKAQTSPPLEHRLLQVLHLSYVPLLLALWLV